MPSMDSATTTSVYCWGAPHGHKPDVCIGIAQKKVNKNRIGTNKSRVGVNLGELPALSVVLRTRCSSCCGTGGHTLVDGMSKIVCELSEWK
jgi:hypothetical protein